MPRVRDPERLFHLISSATEVFIDRGYRRTQMSDIAQAAGMAKGTLYLYVESKEALFDLAVRAANDDLAAPETLPVPTPRPGSTERYVQETLQQETRLPKLEAALGAACPEPDAVRAELEGIVRELYGLLYVRRLAVKLIDRNAADYPDLAAIYFTVARNVVPGLIEQYLQTRLPTDARGGLPLNIVARGIVEVVAFWSIHRHWDPAPTSIEDDVAESTAVRFALGALGA